MAVGFRHLYRTARYLRSCRDLVDLETFLKIPKAYISLLSLDPQYYKFDRPKKNGGVRKIEAPNKDLKELLKKLNFALQCVYFFEKSEAAYGFVMSHKGNKSPRNILTNARKHLHAPYLLNVDFKDFFHQISKNGVFEIFSRFPFHFSKETATILSKLCTYKGRLPMGSPTSPVLSNFVTLPLDLALGKMAIDKKITFTRFVDDLTFSSKEKMGEGFLNDIGVILNQFNLSLNNDKTKWYGPAEVKVVTGLEVFDKVSVPGSFYYELSQDLQRLKYSMEAQLQVMGKRENEMIETFKQQVSGKIGFLQMILGFKNEKYLKYLNDYEEAINPEVDKLSIRWTDFPYNHF